MKYFICASIQFPDVCTTVSFVLEHNSMICTVDDIYSLSRNAEEFYKQKEDARKDYTSFMLISYTRMDEVQSSQISGGTVLL